MRYERRKKENRQREEIAKIDRGETEGDTREKTEEVTKGRDRRKIGGKETTGKRQMGEICSRAVEKTEGREGTESYRGHRGLLRKQRSIERIEVRRGHRRL